MTIEDCSICAYLDEVENKYSCNGQIITEYITVAKCPYSQDKSIFAVKECPKLKGDKE